MPQSTQQRSSFSTSSILSSRAVKKRDGNTRRGESALRRTGTKYPNGMSSQPLPQPVLDPSRISKIDVDPNHGLWEFFNKDREALTDPKKGNQCGRAWTVEELRHKSWEDLHSLWYICCKERNRLATETKERKRLYVKVEDLGARKRDLTIRATQSKIKHTLTERWYAWEEAWKVAEHDPEVDLKADLKTPAYQPRALEDEEEVEEQPRAAAGAA